jgi:2'-5' RNA ligase
VRIGVVLAPEPGVAAELVGLRRALRAPSLLTQPPHLTLVPPVNIGVAEIAVATAVLRRAAAATRPLSLSVGPADVFPPSGDGSCVLHLHVGGADRDELGRLREAVFVAPFERRVDHPFVPHLTLHESMTEEAALAAVGLLRGATWTITAGELVALVRRSQGWEPWCSVPLGRPVVRGRGGVEVELRTALVVGPEAAALGLVEPPRTTAGGLAGPPPLRCPDRVVIEGVVGGRFAAAAVASDAGVESVGSPEVAGLGVEDLVRREASDAWALRS